MKGVKTGTKPFTLHDVTRMSEFYNRSEFSVSNIDAHIFFILANRTFPSSRSIGGLAKGIEKVNKLRHRYGIGDENLLSVERFVPEKGSYGAMHSLVMVTRNLMVEFFVENGSPTARVLYSHETHADLLDEVCGMIRESVEKNDVPRIGLLSMEGPFGTHLANIEIDPPEADLELFYNDDLLPISETIIRKLNEPKGKGLVLLHGVPGTGKTTFIRHLASKISKQLIFIPFEVARQISSPEFISFMLSHKESVLVIEDAESLLKSREDGENLNISSLLNLSDGLLSDALRTQLVCTFNTGLHQLDKALMRKGRIIARYEFMPLSVTKSTRLCEKIGCHVPVTRPMTLAEIFHARDEDYSLQQSNKIGFSVSGN